MKRRSTSSAVTWDDNAGTGSIALDGDVKTYSFTAGALADPLRVTMGNFSDNASQLGTQFDGRIYDLQIYSGVLSSSEITNLVDNPGTAIPEPSTYALWAACVALGVVLLRRRT